MGRDYRQLIPFERWMKLRDYPVTTTKWKWRRGKIDISRNIAPFLERRPREESWNQELERGILKANMFSKDPKRILHWISKAWTPYEKLGLPVSYGEAIARLLALKHLRNLIETQEI